MPDNPAENHDGKEIVKVTNLYLKSPGRKSKLTPELIDTLVEYVKNGNYISTACQAVGISVNSYHNWLNKGDDFYAMFRNAYGADAEVDEEILKEMVKSDIITEHQAMCVRFAEALNKASGESEALAVLHVRKAFGDDWKAAMTFLERRFPTRWRRRTGIEVENVNISDDQRAQERAVLGNPEAVALQHEALRLAAGDVEDDDSPEDEVSTGL
jgi:CRISPR/Cas system CMR-associated protein Cmr5 small subunit